MIRQVLNSLTVHDNSWTLKFDNFSEFKNVISDSLSSPKRHYDALRTKIDMWLTLKNTYFEEHLRTFACGSLLLRILYLILNF